MNFSVPRASAAADVLFQQEMEALAADSQRMPEMRAGIYPTWEADIPNIFPPKPCLAKPSDSAVMSWDRVTDAASSGCFLAASAWDLT